MAFKEPGPLVNNLTSEKPLHVRSLENQVSYNPRYKKIADSLSNESDINDAYFYALKDAYERHGYNPSEKDIREEAWNKYYELSDAFKDSRGYGAHDWDWYGIPEFEKKYGTEDDFIQKLIDAHNKEWGAI